MGGREMKRLVYVALLATGVMLVPAQAVAQASNQIDLFCQEIFSPTDVPVMAAGGWRIGDHTGLINIKAHPLKADVYFVTCKGVGVDAGMQRGSDRYFAACKIIANSFGQWIENGTGRGGQRFVWQTWNCKDVLNVA